MTSDDDRIAYLAGDVGASLDDDDRADLEALRGLLADPSMWAEPDRSLEDRVVAAVTAEAGTGGSRLPAPPTTAPPSRRAIRSERRRPSRRRILSGAVGAAAAIAATVAVSIGALTGGTSAKPYAAALSATTLAPGASGAATLTKTTSGWRIELHANGLARLDNGRYYEAWMNNVAGVHVPVGTFNEGTNVTLWSGVSPLEYPTLTVTEQNATGNPASSGRQVLAGTVTPPKSS